jgi:hypothetical protein
MVLDTESSSLGWFHRIEFLVLGSILAGSVAAGQLNHDSLVPHTVATGHLNHDSNRDSHIMMADIRSRHVRHSDYMGAN